MSTIAPRTEAERMVLSEAGGSNPLGLHMIHLMRDRGMTSMHAVAIVRACKWTAVEGNVPDEFIGRLGREDLKELLVSTCG